MVRKTGVGFLLSLVFVLFTYSSAVAEWYVGGAIGVSIPQILLGPFVRYNFLGMGF